MDEHLYIVAYDISDQRRWRSVFRTMNGYGQWLQLSIFQCRLSRKRHIQLRAALDEIINHGEDHVIIMDLGVAESVNPRVQSLGKEFTPVEKSAIIV
jgi:CRISPR-associated protein Cas2